jgi:hypothetical protein
MVWRWLTVTVVRKGLDMVWYIEGCVSMGNLDVFATDKALGDYRVCMIDCDDETVSESDHEANARLIAAAPDMLAALESVIDDLVGGIQDTIDNGGSEAWIAEANTRLNAARAAIAKAKGEA